MIKSPALRVFLSAFELEEEFLTIFWTHTSLHLLWAHWSSLPASSRKTTCSLRDTLNFYLAGVVGSKMDLTGSERTPSWTPLTGAQQGPRDTPPPSIRFARLLLPTFGILLHTFSSGLAVTSECSCTVLPLVERLCCPRAWWEPRDADQGSTLKTSAKLEWGVLWNMVVYALTAAEVSVVVLL